MWAPFLERTGNDEGNTTEMWVSIMLPDLSIGPDQKELERCKNDRRCWRYAPRPYQPLFHGHGEVANHGHAGAALDLVTELEVRDEQLPVEQPVLDQVVDDGANIERAV